MYWFFSGFQLMGFKPSSLLKKYYHVKPAQFIYPDETVNACKDTFIPIMKSSRYMYVYGLYICFVVLYFWFVSILYQ